MKKLAICAALTVMCGCQSNQLVLTTYTKVGLHMSGTGDMPNNVTFGYKRFEGAIIPVDPKEVPTNPAIPSLSATLAMTNKWFGGIYIYQTFATGAAAERKNTVGGGQ